MPTLNSSGTKASTGYLTVETEYLQIGHERLDSRARTRHFGAPLVRNKNSFAAMQPRYRVCWPE